MHTKNLENSSKIECFMGQNASVQTSKATTVGIHVACKIFQPQSSCQYVIRQYSIDLRPLLRDPRNFSCKSCISCKFLKSDFLIYFLNIHPVFHLGILFHSIKDHQGCTIYMIHFILYLTRKYYKV